MAWVGAASWLGSCSLPATIPELEEVNSVNLRPHCTPLPSTQLSWHQDSSNVKWKTFIVCLCFLVVSIFGLKGYQDCRQVKDKRRVIRSVSALPRLLAAVCCGVSPQLQNLTVFCRGWLLVREIVFILLHSARRKFSPIF